MWTRRKGRQLLSPRHPRKCCRGKSSSDVVRARHYLSDYRHRRSEETHSRYGPQSVHRALLELWVCRVIQWSKLCHRPSLNREIPFLCFYEGCIRGRCNQQSWLVEIPLSVFFLKPNWVSGIRWFWLTNVVSLEARMRSRSLLIELRRLMGR